MARSDFNDLKAPLAKALLKASGAGAAGLLGPVWGEAVGNALGGHSRPVRLADAVLTVEVDREFAPSVRHAEATLCERLNGRLGRGSVRRLEVLAR